MQAGREVAREQVVRDLASVVDRVRAPTGHHRVDLVGWATGGHWAAWYASEHPGRVEHLVVHNSLYGAIDGHPVLGRALVPRGELDFWSREGDVTTLVADLDRAADVRVAHLAGATHFVHLDRAGHGRDRLLDQVLRWLR